MKTYLVFYKDGTWKTVQADCMNDAYRMVGTNIEHLTRLMDDECVTDAVRKYAEKTMWKEKMEGR